MFNFREFVLNNLINGVKNGSFTKEYASILATNYLLKGILSQEDIARFDSETTIEEVIDEVIDEMINTSATEEVGENVENIVENTVENVETIEESGDK